MEKSNTHNKQEFSWKTLVSLLSLVLLVAIAGVSGSTVFNSSASASGWIWDLFDFSKLIINKAKAPSLQLKTFSFPSPIPTPTLPAMADIQSCLSGSGTGLDNVEFDEPEILVDYSPKPPQTVGPGGYITLWAGDESGIVLGAAKIDNLSFDITAITLGPPQTVTVDDPTNPLKIGATVADGAVDSAGRPLFPALFLTDITGISPNDPAYRAGDWQNVGANAAIAPHFISGTWGHTLKDGSNLYNSRPKIKNVVNKIWNLAPGGASPEPGKSYDDDTYYGAEIRWYVDKLTLNGQPLIAGHAYRAQFMTRDGDQSGSDVAQGCVAIQL